ncbi:MAG: sulfatase-like hydrolase/transferase [Burkholderiaceae bacterium]|nr:sulfatase-like hydrolase/transferase [Burkholderiaceae bacterium]
MQKSVQSLCLLLRLLVISCASYTLKEVGSLWAIGVVIEFIVLLLASRVICNRAIRSVFLLPFIFIESLQIANIEATGLLIEPLTIINLGEASSVGKTVIVAFLIVVTWFLLWIPDLLEKRSSQSTKRIVIALCVLLGVVTISYTTIGAFINNLITAYRIVYFEPVPTDGKEFFRPYVTERKTPPVFQNQLLDFSNKNVILIFTEGTSRRVISKTLTPHAYQLTQEGLSVENYFNHTAATFRGIRGQLISGYQLRGGVMNNGSGIGQTSESQILTDYQGRLESLPEMLNQKGYNTVFLSPHPQHFALNTLMTAVGFKKVLGSQGQDRTDKELYEQLFQEADKLSQKKSPFFLATYVLGTHLGMDSPHLKFGSGDNAELNKYYNQDHWLGVFLKKLKQSEWGKNTLIVFTSDHSSYPSSQFKTTFSSKNPYFIDQIPLIFWYQNMQTGVLNAKGKNSLTLAPTLADLLGLREEKNHFLGYSLFEPKEDWASHLSVFDFETYRTNQNGVEDKALLYERVQEIHNKVEKFFSFGG